VSYHPVGAGPGPVEKYKVDAPWPWGDDTEIALPVQEMINDAWAAAVPRINELESKLIDDMENELTLYGPKLAKDVMDNVVMPRMRSELEVAFAEIDMMKDDVSKTLIAVGGMLVLAVGVGAWWLKKGR
jgi:hypothetical protein